MNLAARTIDITPRAPGPLFCAPVAAPWTSVHSRLECNIVVLATDAASTTIVSLDVLYPGLLPELVRQRLPSSIDRDSVIFAASHTHQGPPTDPALRRLGDPDLAYLADVATRVASSISDAHDELTGASVEIDIAYGRAQASHAVWRRRSGRELDLRRRRIERGVQNRPNRTVPIDDAVSTFSLVRRGADRPAAVVWSYACHPSSFPGFDQISSDFPGAVREHVRSHFGSPLPVVFLQGFSGAIRCDFVSLLPRDPRYIPHALVGLQPMFVFPSLSRWNAWCSSLAAVAIQACDRAAPLRSGSRLASNAVHVPLATLCDAQPLARRTLDLQAVRLSNEHLLLALNAEAMPAHLECAQRLAEGTTVTGAGCCGHTFGYLPTSAMVEEGGYEVSRYLSAFYGSEGSWAVDLDAQVARAVELAIAPC